MTLFCNNEISRDFGVRMLSLNFILGFPVECVMLEKLICISDFPL